MDKTNFQDEQLILLTAKGDNEAFDILIRRHQRSVYSLAVRFISNKTAAQDIAQEAFLRVYQSAGRFEPKAEFTTWLYRIVYNLCVDYLRKSRHISISDESMETLTAAEDTAGWVEKNEISEKIHTAIAQLPQRQRQALIMHRFGGLSHNKIAEIMGSTNAAVESLLVRAYNELRITLKDLKDVM